MTSSPSPARAAVDDAVTAERRHLADYIADLADEQRATPSMCTAWAVRDVIAPLTVTTRSILSRLLPAAVRARAATSTVGNDPAPTECGRRRRGTVLSAP